jgi:hypothetical protein
MASVIGHPDVLVAGVPWPRYKLAAVVTGFLTLLLVGALTASAAPSVLCAAGVAVVVGLTLKALEVSAHPRS